MSLEETREFDCIAAAKQQRGFRQKTTRVVTAKQLPLQTVPKQLGRVGTTNARRVFGGRLDNRTRLVSLQPHCQLYGVQLKLRGE